MAIVILYMDDFVSYGAVSDDPADQFARLTEPGTYTPDPNIDGESYLAVMTSSGSGKALLSAFDDPYSQRAFPFSGPVLIAHVAGRFCWPEYGGTGKNGIGPGATVNDTTAFGLQIEDGGYLSLFNWANDTTILRTLNPVVHATSTTHIEAVFTFVDAEGDAPDIIWNYTVQAFVEGVEVDFADGGVFTLTDQSTNDGQFNLAGIVSCGGQWDLLTGDLIIATEDETGGDTTVGTLFVGSQLAASDVSNTGPWVPSTGSSLYPILATQPAGADYIAASADDLPETAVNTLTSVNPKATAIAAVMTVMRGQKVDGGDAGVTVSAVSPSGEGDGGLLPMTADMTNYTEVFPVDPGTDTDWTVPNVNSLKLKIERTV